MAGGPKDELIGVSMDLGEDFLDFVCLFRMVRGTFELAFHQLIRVLPILAVYWDCVGVETFCPLRRLVASSRCVPQLRSFAFAPRVL